MSRHIRTNYPKFLFGRNLSISAFQLTEIKMPQNDRFSFDGGALDYLVARILSTLVTLFSLGLALPWGICIMERWRAAHTVVNGHRLAFNGTGLQLFGNYIKWWFFTVVTLGIYSFWLIPKITRWTVEHTTFGAKA